MTTPVDPRVDAYLRQLDYALSPLPWEHRREIFDDISRHIAEQLAAAPGDDRAVDDVLGRLGDPADIAREAGAIPYAPPPPPQSKTMEIFAVVLIAVGAFLGCVGWIVGVVLLWMSPRFTRADKWIGTFVPPFGIAGALGIAFAAGTAVSSVGSTTSCGDNVAGAEHCVTVTSGSTWPGILFFGLMAVALVAAIYTTVRLSRRVARMA